MNTFDERTERNIATLLPKAQELARKFMEIAVPTMQRSGCEVRIIGGTRTYAEQDAIYAEGRTKPGPIRTKARGGFSLHNFGIAFDVGIFKGKAYLGDSPLYAVLGAIGQKVGLEWGGSWQFSDEPHFQVKTGLALAQMRERKASGQSIL